MQRTLFLRLFPCSFSIHHLYSLIPMVSFHHYSYFVPAMEEANAVQWQTVFGQLSGKSACAQHTEEVMMLINLK